MLERVLWNRTKAKENQLRHRVRFVDAARALRDPLSVTVEDEDHHELRFRTLGADGEGRVMVVVWTQVAADTVRLISACKASRQEREWMAHERRRH